MSNGIPQSLTAMHLVHALLPDDQAGQVTKARMNYEQVVARLDGQLRIAELWRTRITVFPPAEEPQTLQELVQAARFRLRNDRLREDTDELQARKWVASRILQEFEQ